MKKNFNFKNCVCVFERQEQGSCQALVRAEVGYRSLHDPDMRVTPRVRDQSGMASHIHQTTFCQSTERICIATSITHLGRIHTQMARMTPNFTVLCYTIEMLPSLARFICSLRMNITGVTGIEF